MQLVISDAYEGLKQVIGKVLTGAAWQRVGAFHAECAGPCTQGGQSHRGTGYPTMGRNQQEPIES